MSQVHEAKARELVEKIYRESGYHPQIDNFIVAFAAAFAEAKAEGAEGRVLCEAGGCIHEIEQNLLEIEIVQLKAERDDWQSLFNSITRNGALQTISELRDEITKLKAKLAH